MMPRMEALVASMKLQGGGGGGVQGGVESGGGAMLPERHKRWRRRTACEAKKKARDEAGQRERRDAGLNLAVCF